MTEVVLFDGRVSYHFMRFQASLQGMKGNWGQSAQNMLQNCASNTQIRGTFSLNQRAILLALG